MAAGIECEMYEDKANNTTVFKWSVPHSAMVSIDFDPVDLMLLMTARGDRLSHVTAALDIIVRASERRLEFDHSMERIMAHLEAAQEEVAFL